MKRTDRVCWTDERALAAFHSTRDAAWLASFSDNRQGFPLADKTAIGGKGLSRFPTPSGHQGKGVASPRRRTCARPNSPSNPDRKIKPHSVKVGIEGGTGTPGPP